MPETCTHSACTSSGQASFQSPVTAEQAVPCAGLLWPAFQQATIPHHCMASHTARASHHLPTCAPCLPHPYLAQDHQALHTADDRHPGSSGSQWPCGCRVPCHERAGRPAWVAVVSLRCRSMRLCWHGMCCMEEMTSPGCVRSAVLRVEVLNGAAFLGWGALLAGSLPYRRHLSCTTAAAVHPTHAGFSCWKACPLCC